MLIRLDEKDLFRILEVERTAFIPSIQTIEEVIRNRIRKNHVYLGVEQGKLVGTLALRFARFAPDFSDFCIRNPTFNEYAERDNDKDANAVFVYSIGIVPRHRNAVNARQLLNGAFEIAKSNGMDFLVGDARVPSYNGSSKNPDYEYFNQNDKLHMAIDEYFRTGILPPIELIKQDPVAGFYLRVFPKGKILGITNSGFWLGDDPCGGHMIIEYQKLR